MSQPIRVTAPSIKSLGHAYRGSRTLCGKPVGARQTYRSTSELDDVTCGTCRLILSANPTTNRK
ncbi:hypothetical protein SEA_JFLIX2_44 [Rhodococcus phage Jflix2]|nr:hypothetical protein SEA_JFLIX2_44 [Rhodococcus phage Jflix2]